MEQRDFPERGALASDVLGEWNTREPCPQPAPRRTAGTRKMRPRMTSCGRVRRTENRHWPEPPAIF